MTTPIVPRPGQLTGLDIRIIVKYEDVPRNADGHKRRPDLVSLALAGGRYLSALQSVCRPEPVFSPYRFASPKLSGNDCIIGTVAVPGYEQRSDNGPVHCLHAIRYRTARGTFAQLPEHCPEFASRPANGSADRRQSLVPASSYSVNIRFAACPADPSGLVRSGCFQRKNSAGLAHRRKPARDSESEKSV